MIYRVRIRPQKYGGCASKGSSRPRSLAMRRRRRTLRRTTSLDLVYGGDAIRFPRLDAPALTSPAYQRSSPVHPRSSWPFHRSSFRCRELPAFPTSVFPRTANDSGRTAQPEPWRIPPSLLSLLKRASCRIAAGIYRSVRWLQTFLCLPDRIEPPSARWL